MIHVNEIFGSQTNDNSLKSGEVLLLNYCMVAERLCGNPGKNRRNFTSTGRHMTVRFTTDKMYADTGFLAQYNAIGSGEDLNICKLVDSSQLSLTFKRG